MMTRDEFEKQLYDICQQRGVKLFLNDPSVEKDNGYASCDEVHLGKKYRNFAIYKAIAFHELGHVIINMKRERGVKRYSVNSCFMEEWMAWTIAMRLYAKHMKKPFTKVMGNFVLECLKTHSQTHYSFRDIYGDKMDTIV